MQIGEQHKGHTTGETTIFRTRIFLFYWIRLLPSGAIPAKAPSMGRHMCMCIVQLCMCTVIGRYLEEKKLELLLFLFETKFIVKLFSI